MPGVSQGFLDYDNTQALRRRQAVDEEYTRAQIQGLLMQQAAAQRALQARRAAGSTLYGAFGQPAGGIPLPGAGTPISPSALPAPPPAAPAAPAPGTLSPGGGNPQTGPIAPPQAAPAAPAPAAAPVAPPQQPIQPFQGLPAGPGAAAGGGQIPMPAAAPVGPPKAPDHFNVGKLVAKMQQQGVPPDQVLDQLDAMMPMIQANQNAELQHYRMTLQAEQAATRAYQATIQAYRAQEDSRIKNAAEERRGRQGDERLAQGREKLEAFKAKMARGASGGGKAGGGAGGGETAMLDDATAKFMAEQALAGDRTVFVNLGRGKQGAANVVKVREALQRIAADRGLSGRDVATAMAEFEGMKAGERALGTRTAQFGMAKSEAYTMADLVTKASDSVPRTAFPDVNRALNAFYTKTGDTNIVQFGAAVNSFINAYARAVSPVGAVTMSDKEHAREMLATAHSPEQVKAIVEQLKREMEAAGKAPGQVKGEMRSLMNQGTGAAPGAGGRPKAPAEAEAYLREQLELQPELAAEFSKKYGYLPAGIRVQ